MTAPDGYRLVSLDDSRSREMLHVDSFAFAFTVPERDAGFVDRIMPWDRARGIEVADDARGAPGTLAAVHASFAFGMRVPGGAEIDASGLTWVGVHPGHRRRGLLRAMIDDHFSRSLARGETVSVLIAAETAIYQRFGYGLATWDVRLELSRGVDLRELAGIDDLVVDIDTADEERHGDAIRAVQSRLTRPGQFSRIAPQTLADILTDLEVDRDGGEEQRIAIVRDGAEPVAWALFRRKQEWTHAGPSGTTTVPAWGAVDLRATQRLMAVLADFDLMGSTSIGGFTLDDPFLWRLKDVRGAKIGVKDRLWLRILDVPGALQSRAYAADCDVTIALTDDHLPANAGTWRVQATGGEATVTRTERDADLTMTVQELGAVYLGGTTIRQLQEAALVTEHRPGAAADASRAFASDVTPSCNLWF